MKTLLFLIATLPALAQVPLPGSSTGGGGGSSTGGTIPVYTVATLPTTCTASPNKELAWVTDATIATGRTNLYACTATDTWTQVWGCQGNADGSVTVVGTGLYCDIQVTPGVFGEVAGANTWTGSNTRTNSTDKPPATVFASLPAAASNSGDVYIVTDCLTAACAAGSGTVKVWLRSNGSTYDVVSPGSGVTAQATTGIGGIYAHGTPQSATAGADFAGGTAYGQEFTAAASITVSTAVIYPAVIGGTGRYLSLAIYDSTEAKIGEATPLLTTGLTFTPSIMTFATPVNLSIGQVYYLGVGADAGSGAVGIIVANSNYATVMGNVPAVKRFFSYGTISSAGASQTLPANVSSRSASTLLDPIHVRFNP